MGYTAVNQRMRPERILRPGYRYDTKLVIPTSEMGIEGVAVTQAW